MHTFAKRVGIAFYFIAVSAGCNGPSPSRTEIATRPGKQVGAIQTNAMMLGCYNIVVVKAASRFDSIVLTEINPLRFDSTAAVPALNGLKLEFSPADSTDERVGAWGIDTSGALLWGLTNGFGGIAFRGEAFIGGFHGIVTSRGDSDPKDDTLGEVRGIRESCTAQRGRGLSPRPR